jgi:cysteine desulfurase
MSVYLDYNATAPLRAEARAAMLAAFDAPGNPSSVHGAGRTARALVERSRRTLAKALGAAPSDVIFSAGGTEANNLGVLGLAKANASTVLLQSAVEHSCVRVAARNSDLPVKTIPVTPDGMIDLAVLGETLDALDADARPLLALMMVNNETGVVQPVKQAARMIHDAGGLIHVDAVQALGKMPVSLGALDADALAVSAHKIGGPLGVGALALACGIKLAPRAFGGGQESGHRGGTENVPGIAGFAAACTAALADLEHTDRIEKLRDHVQEALQKRAPDAVIVGRDAPRLCNTLCIATPGFAADLQLMNMDLAGFAISSGSACSSGKVKASVVMLAMGLPGDLSSCAIRISLGKNTTRDELDAFANAWGEALVRTREKESA